MARSAASQWDRCRTGAANAPRPVLFLVAAMLLASGGAVLGETPPAPAQEGAAREGAAQGETIAHALCRIIEGAATRHALPVGFFTRLIWRESGFRADAVSPKGAQGIAQFMPGTAVERGLADPFDPETAVPASAALLAELRLRFGNLGLAAAAYNAGPARVERWLAGAGGLPLETQDYLLFITGRTAEDWAAEPGSAGRAAGDAAGQATPASASAGTATSAASTPALSTPATASALRAVPTPGMPRLATAASPMPAADCLAITAALRRGGGEMAQEIAAITAPWGVQLSGNFSKARALASYQRTQRRFAALLRDTQPMIIGTRLRSRGSRAFYRVRVAQPTRQAATALCNRLRAAGGACIVLPS